MHFRKIARLGVAIIVASSGLAACSKPHAREDHAASQVAGAVEWIAPTAWSSVDVVLPARIKAREEATVTSRLSGRVTKLAVADGANFRRGELLVSFDGSDMRAALESASAERKASEAHYDAARAQATRFDSLFAAGVATPREHEMTAADAEVAAARLAAARSAESSLRESARITAPFDGVLVRRRIDAGAVVQSGQPLLDLRSHEADLVEVALPESELSRLDLETAKVQVGDGPWIDARRIEIDGMTDASTRTRRARFQIAANDAANFTPGAYARIRFGIRAADAMGGAAIVATRGDSSSVRPDPPASLAVPTSSIVRRGGLSGVFIVRDGRVVLRWLRVGRESGTLVEVLAGLDADERVARDPSTLCDGMLLEAGR